MRLAAFAFLWIGCNSEPLPAASSSSALGCHASIRGDTSTNLAADWPPIGTLFPSGIELSCRGAARPAVSPDFNAPDFSLSIPSAAGPFTGGATFIVNLPQQGSDWYRGTCVGSVTTAPERIGDQARGWFSCPSLTGIVDTSPSRSVTVSDGAFDLPMAMPPPE